MTGLVSTKQLAAISKVAEVGFITTVEIYRRTAAAQPAPEYDYGDQVDYPETSPSRRGTVQGWLRTVATQDQAVDGGAIVTTNDWALRVPLGTDILAGDELIIESNYYTVQGTNIGNSLLPYITCDLRRRE